jgi:hypothetical protein
VRFSFTRKFVPFAVVAALMVFVGGCWLNDDDEVVATAADPVAPWTATAVAAPWLDNNPVVNKHDGGWVYSAREDRLYALYGSDNSGRTLYRINHIDNSSTVAAYFTFNLHGSHPVIDDTGTNLYLLGVSTSDFARFNTVDNTVASLADAPDAGMFAHGAWKGGKFWVVLDDYSLYSYSAADNAWSSALQTLTSKANVATSGPGSNLVYILQDNTSFYSYNTVDNTFTTLAPIPNPFDLGGNSQMTWFGAATGFIYARDSANSDNGAIFDIAAGTWHALSDPKVSDDYDGHATYDSARRRLYFTAVDNAWYYQF